MALPCCAWVLPQYKWTVPSGSVNLALLHPGRIHMVLSLGVEESAPGGGGAVMQWRNDIVHTS